MLWNRLAASLALVLATAGHSHGASAQSVPADVSGQWTVTSVAAAPWAPGTAVDRR